MAENNTEDKADVLAEVIEDVKSANSLGDTCFSALFHEARTTTPARAPNGVYNSVAVGINLSDDGISVTSTVKTRRGEHCRWESADRSISLSVKPFLKTQVARRTIVRQLERIERRYRHRAQKQKDRERCY